MWGQEISRLVSPLLNTFWSRVPSPADPFHHILPFNPLLPRTMSSLSTYWCTYQFFGQYGPYDASGPYDPTPFGAAVEKHRLHKWRTLPTKEDEHVEGRCFSAAWMLRLTLLHDMDHGFGLETSQYETWKGLLQFPTTPELVDRSS